MSCPYYRWNHGFYCDKKRENVNEDMYYKYCDTYTYSDDCSIYKGGESSGSSGCYLTSACVEAMGLPDDCHELTTLRAYRDTYLKSLPGGSCEICEYYDIAPRIVEKIHAGADASRVFRKVYEELVLPCVALIEAGKNEEAHQKYKAYTFKLKEQFLN